MGWWVRRPRQSQDFARRLASAKTKMASAAYSFNLSGGGHAHGHQMISGGESGGGRGGRRGRGGSLQEGGDGAGGCCGGLDCFGKCGGAASGEKCTAAKVKSCMKMFFARLFSHVGLCALVVGYALLGAALFKFLEKDNELETRGRVADVRMATLNELYNITGKKTWRDANLVVIRDDDVKANCSFSAFEITSYRCFLSCQTKKDGKLIERFAFTISSQRAREQAPRASKQIILLSLREKTETCFVTNISPKIFFSKCKAIHNHDPMPRAAFIGHCFSLGRSAVIDRKSLIAFKMLMQCCLKARKDS